MLASVYDTNGDGKVDAADTADSVGSTTAAQVADAVGKAHEHSNKTTLDKFGEADGALTFNGQPVGAARQIPSHGRMLPGSRRRFRLRRTSTLFLTLPGCRTLWTTPGR
ncbi:MAG: hypothetical protein L6W00_11975 [Lentisphaeria bacterium]|nr:MAG: hypothetical protein L6W00_11975 [Lentisphaeria bacterium]